MDHNAKKLCTPDQHITVGMVILLDDGLHLQFKHGKKLENVPYDWFHAEVQRIAKDELEQR